MNSAYSLSPSHYFFGVFSTPSSSKMVTVVSVIPRVAAGGRGSTELSSPRKVSGVSRIVSSTIEMLKHCLGDVGVSIKSSEKSP